MQIKELGSCVNMEQRRRTMYGMAVLEVKVILGRWMRLAQV